MQLLVFEDAGYRNLLPLTYSRATFNLRCGFDNLLAKIETAMNRSAEAVFVRKSLVAVMTERQTRRVNQQATSDDQLWINGRLLLRKSIDLPPRSAAWNGSTLLAVRVDRAIASKLTIDLLLDESKVLEALAGLQRVELPEDSAMLISWPWQLVHENAAEIVRQSQLRNFKLLGQVHSGAHLVEDHPIHVGEGARIKPGATLDAERGPVWIGKDTIISPNAVVTGPAFIGDGCTLLPGAIVREASSIGDVCKIGGELEATLFHGYSNKQHDGFLGHSYVGEWVNLGADTLGSDLKNTYGPVRVPINGREVDSSQMFVGAFIGDHTKTAVRTTLPTGCVIGYACNVMTPGYTPKFVPSFSWLTEKGIVPHDPQKALAVARTVVARRNRSYSRHEENLFLSIAEESARTEWRG